MIDTYCALALREPYLELLLMGLKTVETRTRCLRNGGGEVVLVRSLQINEEAWADSARGGLIPAVRREEILRSGGRLAGLVVFGNCRYVYPGVDDAAACFKLPERRFGWDVIARRRVEEVLTQRLRPDGVTVVGGASQGLFRVPRSIVRVRGMVL